jgi:hypothetical protein
MKCTQCSAKCGTYLCNRCQSQLRDWLTGMPRWLMHLEEAVTGQTRLGESARRSSEKGSPALCRLGPKGDFARSPSQLLNYTNSVLVEWVRDICETRGVQIPVFGPVRNPEPSKGDAGIDYLHQACALAVWLSERVSVIAADHAAAVCFKEIRGLVGDIEHAINRPKPPRFLGPCATLLTNGYGTRTCNVALTAHRDAVEVQCPACKTTHNVDKLQQETIDSVRDQLYTRDEIMHLMAAVGQPIPLRTWRHWITTGKITHRNTDTTAEPRYWLIDAMQARSTKPQTNTTGGARHKPRTEHG